MIDHLKIVDFDSNSKKNITVLNVVNVEAEIEEANISNIRIENIVDVFGKLQDRIFLLWDLVRRNLA